jgi:uncharacterized membrane protein YbhN (UPF0104 family)
MNFNTAIKKYSKYIGVIFSLASLFYILIILNKNLSLIGDILSKKQVYLVIITGLALYAITQLNSVSTWYIQLHQKHPKMRFSSFYKIIGTSQIGKYLPGNIGHIIGRVFLAKQYEIKLKEVTTSILYESLLLIFSGLLISIGYFIYFDHIDLGIDNKIIIYLFIVVSILILAFIISRKVKLFNFLPNKHILYIILLNLFSFIILGLILFIIQYLLIDESISIIKLIIAIAISFVSGFIVPGSPGGIGVREFIFVTLLTSNLNEANALVMIVTLRLITVIGDIGMYLISLKINRDRI